MRIGFTTSIVGHAVLLALGLVSLPGAEPYEVEQVDALPVDLVPIAEVTALSEGVKTAPKSDTASQAKVETPRPRPDSERVGAAPTDQDTPVTETATETAAAEAAEAPPPPPPPPPAPAEPVPEPEPEVAEPAPEPEPEPVEPPPPAEQEVAEIPAEPEPEVAEAPAPVPPSVKPRQKPTPPKPVETASTETTASTRRDSAERRPVEDVTRPEQAEKEFDPTEMAALLNKVDPSGGGGRASSEDASLGSRLATGSVAEMSQSEIDALRAAIEACWTPPVGAEGVDQLMVPIRVEFNIDGSLATEPVAREIPPGPVGQVMAEAALRAVRRCAPYPFLPQEKFETWRTVNINFRPPAMF
jgi:hypothetical protein